MRICISIAGLFFLAPFVLCAKLSPLSKPPLWRDLDVYQETLTREEFEKQIQGIYSIDRSFFDYLQFSEDDKTVAVFRDKEKTQPLWTYHFAPKHAKRQWHAYPFFSETRLREIRGATTEQPLKGMTICLDPGHIGGKWSNLEERYFRIRGGEPIQEGDLNLLVCRNLARLLEKAGANVVWTKQDAEPVTDLRPEDLTAEAALFLPERISKKIRMCHTRRERYRKALKWTEDLLFYRAAEIRARAKKINHELKPDLTVCIHFNAYPWRWRPRLFKGENGLILFVHGSYSAKELEYDNHKYRLLHKLFEQSSKEEIAVAEAVALKMQAMWGFPPLKYDPKFANRVSPNPYIWSRNVLANRLYNGPVVFVEGPLMNDSEIYYRILAGDYEGLKKIQGKEYRSLFREYAEAVAQGIIHHYMGWNTP